MLKYNLMFRKKICCGTIFVGPFREAIIDPRFIEKCNLHKTIGTPIMLPKLENPLFTIEKIIESELKNFSNSQNSSEEIIISPFGGQKESQTTRGDVLHPPPIWPTMHVVAFSRLTG